MGKQVRIAHTEEDEAIANSVLNRSGTWLCLPRFLDSLCPEVFELGACQATDQIIFPESAKALITERIVPVAHDSGRFHLFPKESLCIEWTRTRHQESKYLPGRYYVERAEFPTQREIMRAFDQLSRWIKGTHPQRTDGRVPVFVGPSLSTLIELGEAEVVFPSGQRAELKPIG